MIVTDAVRESQAYRIGHALGRRSGIRPCRIRNYWIVIVAEILPVDESVTVSVTVPAAEPLGTVAVKEPPDDETLTEPVPAVPKQARVASDDTTL